MNDIYAVRADKIVTVSERGSIYDGVMIIENGKIIDIGRYDDIKFKLNNIKLYYYENKVITPSLIDCHCHLLEYAPAAIYSVTKDIYLEAGRALLFKALLSGITCVGEQICGSPICNISLKDYMDISKELPIRIKYSLNSVTIGTKELSNYNCLFGNKKILHDDLKNIMYIESMAKKSEFPGENIFINTTPANLSLDLVPRAGELVFNEDELKRIVDIYHENGKRVGAHVAGKEGIDLAIKTKVDVLHHAHGITDEQILKLKDNNISVVATPLGGSHISPNSPNNILSLIKSGVDVSIATDSYLPPDNSLGLEADCLYGSDILMYIANPSMNLLLKNGFDENQCLALLTYNPAKILGIENSIGKLDIGMDADFLVCKGIPALDIVDTNDIREIFIKGKKIVSR